MSKLVDEIKARVEAAKNGLELSSSSPCLDEYHENCTYVDLIEKDMPILLEWVKSLYDLVRESEGHCGNCAGIFDNSGYPTESVRDCPENCETRAVLIKLEKSDNG